MGLATFKGGVHPYEGKDLSRDKAIKELSFDGEYAFPMAQGLGAPSKPIVAVGDHVLAGMKIAEPGGPIGAVVTSSVSGTVKAIELRMTHMGTKCQTVVVESDGLFKEADGIGAKRDLESLSPEEIVDIVKEAGIIGMGGAGFPTHVKLAPKDPAAIDYVIANGSECEPMLTNDYRLMIEEPDRIIGGMKALLRIFPNARGVIAIENNKPDAIAVMKELTENEDRMSVEELLTKYPEGGERQLIYAITGRSFYSKMLPADVGCIVDNVATIAAINDAVFDSTPIMKKNITVTGDALNETANVRIRLGVSYSSIVEAVGGYREDPAKIVCGGPMMGLALADTDVPVTKNSSALCAFIHDESTECIRTNCIRCGRCVNACPIFLVPPILTKAVNSGDIEKFEKLGGTECVECGVCSYVCPAKRPVTELMKKGRAEAAKRAKQAAAKAKAMAAAQARMAAAKAKEEAARKAAAEKPAAPASNDQGGQ